MSKLMIILGIIVAAAGVVTGALIYLSPGQMQVLGLTPEAAAIALVGGLGLIGLGGVIVALDRTTAATHGLRDLLTGQENGQLAPASSPSVVSDFTTATIAPPPFPVPTPPPEPSPSPSSRFDSILKESKAETNRVVAESKETITALDKARDKLEEVLRPAEPEPPTPAPPEGPAQAPPEGPAEAAKAEETAEVPEEVEDTTLYVV
jgi:hypothetical protein